MVIPQPMSQKNPDFQPLSPIYGQNTGLRALAVGLMPRNLRTQPFLGQNHKKRIWGPVEAVSAKFSGDLKVVHGDSAIDEPKKSEFWALGPDLCPKYRFARALAVGLMPRNLRT